MQSGILSYESILGFIPTDEVIPAGIIRVGTGIGKFYLLKSHKIYLCEHHTR